jgi:putative heme iron utilization protein
MYAPSYLQSQVLPRAMTAMSWWMPAGVSSRCRRSETISRLTQAGVALVNTRVAVLEAMADNAHPKANEIYATLPAGLVVVDDADDRAVVTAQSPSQR